ncbi:unnamed protein product [Pieris macdunnoughi]|uniref:Uncharacterized protein n=1 Tax=Pieris macdunnoughi TaxID=345717 RepID=A0A821NYF3_9NEOP|nr:unnamed protein product [Pieris macdunnoughi]
MELFDSLGWLVKERRNVDASNRKVLQSSSTVEVELKWPIKEGETFKKYHEYNVEVVRKDGLLLVRDLAAEVKNHMDFKINAVKSTKPFFDIKLVQEQLQTTTTCDTVCIALEGAPPNSRGMPQGAQCQGCGGGLGRLSLHLPTLMLPSANCKTPAAWRRLVTDRIGSYSMRTEMGSNIESKF